MKLTELRPDVVIEGKKGENPFAKKEEDKDDKKSENPFAKKDDDKEDDDKSDDKCDDKDGKKKGGFIPGKKGVDPFPPKKGEK